MTWPTPQPGLVVRYSYLWSREAGLGRDEGVKDRPCAVVLVIADEEARPRVVVLPITRTRPQAPEQEGVELPADTKARLGLDPGRSWVIVNETNHFRWPGPDLRMLPGQGPESATYGTLPPRLFDRIRERFIACVRARRLRSVTRTE